jgi:hypothetical protein
MLRLAFPTSYWWCGCAVVEIGAPETSREGTRTFVLSKSMWGLPPPNLQIWCFCRLGPLSQLILFPIEKYSLSKCRIHSMPHEPKRIPTS